MKYSQSHILRIHRTNERNRSTKNVTIFAREKKRFRTSSIVVIHKATFCILNNRSRVLLYYTACSSKTNEIPLPCSLSPLFSKVSRQLLEKFQKNHQDPFEYMDLVALVAPIGIFFGRVAENSNV